MAYDYSDLAKRARSWAEDAINSQRLARDKAQAILEIDSRAPDNLFGDIEARPLIVAFMGGTGVGKSTLLNRLAGQEIARTGVERPTSREVTLYHHDSISIQALPAGLPLDKIKVCQHRDDSKKNIVWVDMPDFDSIEAGNKKLVLEWMPHIDVLLYVVSPERYRDNKAWQLLLAEGARHAWIFVLNQWDRGLASQYDDFKRQLAKAGFTDPLVFKTSCTGQADDEFAELLNQLDALSTGHTVKELEQRGREARLLQLQQTLQGCRKTFAGEEFQQLAEYFQQQWQQTEALLSEGFRWPLRQIAKAYAEKGGSTPQFKLWDEWAQSRLDDLLDDVTGRAGQLQLPVKPLKGALLTVRENAEKTITTHTQLACRQAMIKPGNAMQRFFIKFMRVAEFLLPIATISLVSYEAVIGYYQSAVTGEPYLGVNFAIHSVLLIALSWLVPFFLAKKLQPSLEKTALIGLEKGLQAAFVQISLQISRILDEERESRQQLMKQVSELINLCQQAGKRSGAKRHGPDLDRMMID